MSEKPGIVTVYFQLMKLRVVILLQITAICAIIAHDLMVRSESISGDRTWTDTLEACIVTLVGGTLAAGGSNAINMVYDRDIDPGMSRTRTRPIPNGWISSNGHRLNSDLKCPETGEQFVLEKEILRKK